MLPIPKELLGQKAIPFMEFIDKESCFTTYKYPEGEEDYYEVPREIFNFYNQSFQSEMLMEYFEGFEYSEHFGRICYKFHNLLYLKEYTIADNKCFDLRIDTFERVNKDYLTLNLFITLCLNRDINLTWKGETE